MNKIPIQRAIPKFIERLDRAFAEDASRTPYASRGPSYFVSGLVSSCCSNVGVGSTFGLAMI
jgi:hypothetical protein